MAQEPQPEPQARIDAALAQAADRGIPVLLLERKIAEGRAKGVALEAVATAVERRAAALERAAQVMQGQEGTGDAELAVGADAVEAGVSEAVLEAVATLAPQDRRAVAIAALTQLVALGHAPDVALARVRAALDRGPEALINLPAEAGQGRGGPPFGLPGPADGRGPQGGPPANLPVPGGAPQGNPPGGPPEGAGPPAGLGGPPVGGPGGF